MNEEEKKDLKKIVERIKHLINDNYCYCTTSLDDWEFVLNLIKKQQKEIEDLKEDLSKKVKALDIAMSNPDYICKDKIREIINKSFPDTAIQKIIELLGE